MATGTGLRPVGRIGGGTPQVRTYYIPSTNSTALFEGDVVELVNTTGVMDPKGEVQQISQFVTGHIPLGVVVGFEVDASDPYKTHRAASTNRYVKVCDDPKAIYEAQEDAVGGAVTQALIGAMTNCALIVAAGSTATGLSGTMVDSSTTTASAADVKIIGVRRDGVNAGAQSGGALLLVRLNGAAIDATDSQS